MLTLVKSIEKSINYTVYTVQVTGWGMGDEQIEEKIK